MKKKVLSGFLILSLLLGTLTGAAMAEDQTAPTEESLSISAEKTSDNGLPADTDPAIEDDLYPEENSETLSDPSDAGTPIGDPLDSDREDDPVYHVRYRAHVQGIGWQEYVMDGEMAGTTGLAKRMEALNIEIVKEVPQEDGSVTMEPVTGAIEYCAHVQGIGWQDYVADGAMIGTSGQAKRVEAFCLRLTGEVAEQYDIYYRTHIQTFAQMDWAKNDEMAGSTGLAKRMESMEIKLVKKSEPAPGNTDHPCYSPTCKGTITYRTHVQTYGWMDSVADGVTSGTQGESKRMEALNIWLTNPKDASGNPIPGSIEYCTHVQGEGWQNYVANGELSGTSGLAKRVEAIRIRLTGQLADLYHVYYRVHAQTYGTLGWARDDEIAGTSGLAKRLEYLEVKLVAKSDTAAIDALESTGISSISSDMIGGLTAGFYDQAAKSWDEVSGTTITIGETGISRINESLKASVITGEGLFDGGINYETHIGSIGWTSPSENGAASGTPDSGHEIQAVKLSLTGDLAKYCDIYYRAHIQAYGWIGWAMNGQIAGSTGCGYRLEALQICITLKGATAPGPNNNYCKTVKKGSKMIALTFDDGPGARTMELLNCLEQHGAHATFFVLGTNISRYASCLKKAAAIGCEVGNHTYSHATLTGLSAAGISSEISRTNTLIRQNTGYNAPFMRPPGGGQNASVRAAVGCPLILWSVDTLDWKTKSTSATINSVLGNAKDGDIILMHDIHSATINAALQLIPILQSRGFELVTVSELAQAKGVNMKAGNVYSYFH